MSLYPRYLVTPDPDAENPHNYDNEVLLTATIEEALAVAHDAASDEGRTYMVFSWEVTVDAPAPVGLEEEYQVKPGRDFPATL